MILAFLILGLARGITCGQMPADPLSRPDKTELADAYGVVAATGTEFGIPWMWWWHRINAGWGAVRPTVAALTVFDETSGAAKSLRGGTRVWRPNHLHQEMDVDGIHFAEDKFLDGDALAEILRLKNSSGQRRKLRLYFQGKIEGHGRIRFDPQLNALRLTTTRDYGKLYLPGKVVLEQCLSSSKTIAGWAVGSYTGDVEKLFGRDIGFGALINDANVRRFSPDYEGNGFYYVFEIDLDLPAGGSDTLTLCNTFSTDEHRGEEHAKALLANTASVLQTKTAQEDRFFANEVPQLITPDEKLNRLWYHLWYVLHSNRVKKGKVVAEDFNVPTKFGYWGCYVWDTAFHVIGEAFLNNHQIAQDSVLALLSMQYPTGFIPVNSGADDLEVISKEGPTFDLDSHDFYSYKELTDPFYSRLEVRHPTPHVWGVPQVERQIEVAEKTQMPIVTMSVWELYKAGGDKAFLAKVYPKLAQYDDWTWRRRNTGDGLMVYYHSDESGWDNATRLFPLPVKSVDGSVAAYLQRQTLARIASILGRDPDEMKFRQRAELTARSINEKMWDERDSFYHDVSYEDVKRPQKSLAGFLPLMAKICSPVQQASLKQHLKDPREFWTPYPVPTISCDDPQYAASVWGWNGPVWVPTNWFVMEGLARNGDFETANEIFRKTVAMMSMPTGYPTSAEQYNPETGVFFGVPDYSWCGVLNHYIITRLLGLEPEAAEDKLTIRPHLPQEWKSARLSNVHVGGHVVSVAYDYGTVTRGLTITHSGSRALAVEVLLSVSAQVKRVRIAGATVPPANYRITDGILELQIGLHNETKSIEVAY